MEFGCANDRPQHRHHEWPCCAAAAWQRVRSRWRGSAGTPRAVLRRRRSGRYRSRCGARQRLGSGSNAALIHDLVRRAPCRVGGGIRDLDTARRWLDAGATQVMIGTAATPEFCGALPRDRVIAAVDAERGAVVVDGWRAATGIPVAVRVRELAPVVGGFLFTQVEREG